MMTLSDLPAEILHEISGYLSYASHLALAMTCPKLYVYIGGPNRPGKTSNTRTTFKAGTKPYGMADLLEIERWPCYNGVSRRPLTCQQPIDQLDFFACYRCLKIRSAGQFSNAMMKGKRGKLGTGTVEQKSQRVCIPCGIAHGIYQRGTSLQFGGTGVGYGIVCHQCGRFDRVGTPEVPTKRGKFVRCSACKNRTIMHSDLSYLSVGRSKW